MSRRVAPEIGSEFPLLAAAPPDPGYAWRAGGGASRALTRLAVPPEALVLRSGRDGLAVVTAALAAQGARTLFLPAFACDSLWAGNRLDEVEVLRVDASLQPRPEAIHEAARHGGRVAVLAMPLFGRPLGRAVREALSGARERGVWIVDDLSHGILSAAVEALGTVGLASLRKWAALPDGGLAWGVAEPEWSPAPADGAAGFAAARAAAQHAKGRWLRDGVGDKGAFLAALADAERTLDGAGQPAGMSASSLALLAQVPWAAVARVRRDNHERLSAALAGLSLPLTPLCPGPLPDGVVPLGLPVLFADGAARDRVRRALIERRIYCALHWPLPAPVDPAAHPEAADGAARILTLPCDQRYGAADMERVAAALGEVAA